MGGSVTTQGYAVFWCCAVQQCLRLGNARAAERVRQTFKLPDKRFGWIKVSTLWDKHQCDDVL